MGILRDGPLDFGAGYSDGALADGVIDVDGKGDCAVWGKGFEFEFDVGLTVKDGWRADQCGGTLGDFKGLEHLDPLACCGDIKK